MNKFYNYGGIQHALLLLVFLTGITLIVQAQPVGATINNPVVVSVYNSGGSFSYNNTRNNATANGYQNNMGQASDDIYYRFTLTVPASLSASLCGSTFDTYLHLLDASGTVLQSNDDNGPLCAGTQSSLQRQLSVGTYYIVTEGYSSYSGNLVLSLSLTGMQTPLVAGTLSPPTQSIAYNTAPANLSTTTATGGAGSYTYQWQISADNSNWANLSGATATSYGPPALTASIYYRIKITSGSETVYTNTATITVAPPPATVAIENRNFIKVWEAKYPTINANELLSKSVQDVSHVAQYFDGLGRPEQTVVKQGSLNTATGVFKDVVTPVEYDEFGREAKKYLPFVSADVIGQYKPGALAAQSNYYNESTNPSSPLKGQGESYFYSQTVFEASPLNRVLESYAPGVNWAGTAAQATEASRHGIKAKYWINTNNDSVRIWDVLDPKFAVTIIDYKEGTQTVKYEWSSYLSKGATTSFLGYRELPNGEWIGMGAGSPLSPRIITIPTGDYEYSVIFWKNGNYTDRIIFNSHNSPPVRFSRNNEFADYNSSGFYEKGQLYKNGTVDEHNKQVIEFKDKEGRVVLKKVQLTATPDDGSGKGHTGWICTYYIYDDLGNLRCVIQPEGVKWLAANNWDFSSPSGGGQVGAEQCFRYEYDGRQRMIMKQVPGAKPVYMVYDQRDRLVMTQDGNQRTQNNWLFTHYDNLNRPVATGLIAGAANDFITHINNAAAIADPGATPYPTLPAGTVKFTETFYDDYSWLALKGITAINENYDPVHNGYLYSNNSAGNNNFPYEQKNEKDNRTKGMVTGTKVTELNTPTNVMYTLTVYDSKARPIQVKSINQTGGTDIATTQYSWAGQALVMVTRQEKVAGGSASLTTITKNSYDALGRLIQTTKNIIDNINSIASGEKIIAQNQYDELGQLKNKQLGGPETSLWGAGGLQKYDYNIRGWLLGVNRDYVSGQIGGGAFGFELSYDKLPSFGGAGGGLMFNGNIATIT